MNGVLNEKIATIRDNINGKWPLVLGTGYHYINNHKSIYADHPKGFTDGGSGDYMEALVTVNVQNYKNYFVPSFSLGVDITFTNRDQKL